jgi:hypothetical protein
MRQTVGHLHHDSDVVLAQRVTLAFKGTLVAGRYQGCHVFRDEDGRQLGVEVFWQTNGWYWRCIEDRPPHTAAAGPFTTSTEAYERAKAALYPRA